MIRTNHIVDLFEATSETVALTAQQDIDRDGEEAQASVDKVTRNIKSAIKQLELAITPRRLRDHALGRGGIWLATQDDLITIERAKL